MAGRRGARRWGEGETVKALSLYLQTPFGRIHARNPEIVALAAALGRTPSAVRLKMLDLASLNPELRASGRTGLPNASALDRAVWARYAADWETLGAALEDIAPDRADAAPGRELGPEEPSAADALRDRRHDYGAPVPAGETTADARVKVRRGQKFFRRAVLANYGERCCITGIAEPRLLVASHIVPWKHDVANRLNPANGFALSATFDKAFDSGLLTITETGAVKLSPRLLAGAGTRRCFEPYRGRTIYAAERFAPGGEFLRWHNRYFAERQG